LAGKEIYDTLGDKTGFTPTNQVVDDLKAYEWSPEPKRARQTVAADETAAAAFRKTLGGGTTTSTTKSSPSMSACHDAD